MIGLGGAGGDAFSLEVGGSVDPALQAAIEKLIGSLTQTGDQVARAGTMAARAREGWATLTTGINSALMMFDRIGASVARAAELSAESEALSRNAQRLHLDFDEAAASAGRFVDETEAMSLATRAFESDLDLTQEQLNQLTRRAAIFAQNTGTTTTEAMDRLFAAIEGGSRRALRPFGEDMAALAGDAHSARDRLDAFVRSTQRMADATDDARSSLERMRDEMDDRFREAARGAADEVMRLNAQSRAIHDTLDVSAADFRDFARVLTDVVVGAFHAAAAAAGAALLPAAALFDVLKNIASLRHGLSGMTTDYNATRSMLDVIRGHGLSTGVAFGLTGGEGGSGQSSGEAPQGSGWVEGTGAGFDARAAAAFRRRFGGRAAGGRGGGRESAPVMDLTEIAPRLDKEDALSAQDKLSTLAALAAQIEENAAAKQHAAKAAEDVQAAYERAQSLRDAELARQSDFFAQIEDRFRSHATEAQSTAQLVRGAWDSMTASFQSHLEAVVAGRESFAAAMQGMAADALASLGKLAMQKAAMEGAEAIASLAIGDFSGVARHSAAAVAFTAVGLGASAIAGSIRPAAPASASAGGGGSVASPVGRGAGGSTGAGGPVHITLVFNREVIGGSGAEIAERLAQIHDAGRRLGRAA